MVTLADTYGFIKGLTESGLPTRQAEAIADGLQQVNLLTSEDLGLALAQLETRLTTRLAGFLAIAVAVQSLIVAMIKLFL